MLTTYHETPAILRDAAVPFYIKRLDLEPLEALPADFCTCAGKGYRLLWVSEGGGWFRKDLRKQQVAPGSFIGVQPGQACGLEAATAVKGYIVCFEESFVNYPCYQNATELSSLLSQLMHEEVINTAGTGLHQDIAVVFDRLAAEFAEAAQRGSEVLQLYLRILLIHISRLAGNRPPQMIPAKRHSVAARFFRLLEKEQGNKMQVKDYARLLHVTPNYLNETVKLRTGYPAGYHVRQRIVLEAKKMIAYSDLCSKEIAYALGFWDIAHFSRFFKTNAGMNVSEFRNGLTSGIVRTMVRV
jgi:AraC-like DNA-binding protein